MYVKVEGVHPSLFEVPKGANPLEYGSRVVIEPPWEIDWQKELEVALRFLHYRGDSDVAPHHDVTGGPDFWVVHFAWWTDDDRGSFGIVTTHDLYIMGDNGKTIDRVR